jgi:hypothetical protein
MGALTRSKLDRAVIARYFSFLIISQLIIFTLIGVIFSKLPCPFHFLGVHMRTGSVQQIVVQIGKKASFQEIINNLDGKTLMLKAFLLLTYANLYRITRSHQSYLY